jgi:two-component system LytT family response regulator
MTPLKAIIIEDESRNAQALETLLTEFCEGITVSAIAESVENGYKAIQAHDPDVVFLDVELPGASGFSLFDYYDKLEFSVVFTTAYNEYALKAFEFAAIDYLTKPVEIKRLKAAIQKVRERKEMIESLERVQQLKASMTEGSIRKITLPTLEGFLFVDVDMILRCEGDNNYTTFFLTDKSKIVVSRTLKDYERMLTPFGFFRPHKSHLVNLSKIKKYTRGRMSYLTMEDGSTVEVSIRKKDDLMALLPGA